MHIVNVLCRPVPHTQTDEGTLDFHGYLQFRRAPYSYRQVMFVTTGQTVQASPNSIMGMRAVGAWSDLHVLGPERGSCVCAHGGRRRPEEVVIPLRRKEIRAPPLPSLLLTHKGLRSDSPTFPLRLLRFFAQTHPLFRSDSFAFSLRLHRSPSQTLGLAPTRSDCPRPRI